MKTKNSKGITLISLVITIIILLILAGVVLNLAIGENGLIRLAKQAGDEYNHSQKNEISDLDKLFSSIKISGDSQITLTKEELDAYIKSKMIGNSVGSNTLDSYDIRDFSVVVGEKKSMLSGNSKFGTINSEGELVFDEPGLYYASSSFILNEAANGQIYNDIYFNDEPLIYSFTYRDNSAAPASMTFYANKGDKIKMQFRAYGSSSLIYAWHRENL